MHIKFLNCQIVCLCECKSPSVETSTPNTQKNHKKNPLVSADGLLNKLNNLKKKDPSTVNSSNFFVSNVVKILSHNKISTFCKIKK